MRVNRSLALLCVLACSLVVLAALFGACGGGNSTAAAKPGPLVCDTLATGSYHYTEHVVLAVNDLSGSPSPPPVPTASGRSHSAFSLSTDGQGSVQGANIDAAIRTDTGNSIGDYEVILLADNQAFVRLSGGWQKAENTSNRPVPVPYQPDQICKALAPDVDTTKLGAGQPETVNGVSSQRFTLHASATSFFANEPDFGSQSDVGANIKTLDGTIWVADQGNFITKLDITGVGQYPNGQPISVKMTFELSDLGADIKIGPPL